MHTVASVANALCSLQRPMTVTNSCISVENHDRSEAVTGGTDLPACLHASLSFSLFLCMCVSVGVCMHVHYMMHDIQSFIYRVVNKNAAVC